jgi:hypothetical protein
VAVLETTTAADLRAQIASLVGQGRCFDLVVCVGHGNEQGIRVASDPTGGFARWEDFAGYIRELVPRRLLLVACQAGVWPAANILFRRLPKLRRIFASPVNASKKLAGLMVTTAPYLMAVKIPPRDVKLAAQIAAVGLTGCQLREWQRDADKDDPTGRLFDIGAKLLDPHLRNLFK